MVEPGQVLLGKYRIESILGQGGMGMVACAQHVQLGTAVAIKFLRADLSGKAEVVERFAREAQAAARLQSAHVCRVFDVGQLDSGAPYMVMEYLEGMDLREFARTRDKLEASLVVDFVIQACEALAEAHASGIVHRDLKPANLFVARLADGTQRLKVLDFGISKTRSPGSDQEITHTHTVLGTPAYMSPEQMRSAKNVDTRSDIWSLGIILYELLHGSRPFQGASFTELCLSVNMDPTPPIHASVPRDLAAVVMRCLQKGARERYQSVAELAAALAPFAGDTHAARSAAERAERLLDAAAIPVFIHQHAAEDVPMASEQDAPTTLSMSTGEPTERGNRRQARRSWLAGLAAAAIVGGVIGAVAWVGSDVPGDAVDKPPERRASEPVPPMSVSAHSHDASVIPVDPPRLDAGPDEPFAALEIPRDASSSDDQPPAAKSSRGKGKSSTGTDKPRTKSKQPAKKSYDWVTP